MCANSSCWRRGHLNTVRKWGQLMCLLIWGSEELSKWSWSDISSHRGSCVCCWFKKLFYRLGNDPSRTGGPSQGMACTSLKLRCYLWNCLSEKCAIFQPDKTVTKQTGNREREKKSTQLFIEPRRKREKKTRYKISLLFWHLPFSIWSKHTHKCSLLFTNIFILLVSHYDICDKQRLIQGETVLPVQFNFILFTQLLYIVR